MPRVMLARPLCAYEEPEFQEPLGIERLAGFLRAHDVDDVRLFDRRLYERERSAGLRRAEDPLFWDDVAAAYEAAAPTLVGVSLMSEADVADALRIFSRARDWFPAAQLVAGGLFVTLDYSTAKRRLPADVTLIRYEGEQALLALAQGSEGCVRTTHRANVGPTCTTTVDSLERTHPISVPQHGNAPSPDTWAHAYRPDLERYAALGCAINLQTSRGCEGACAFCATPSLPHGYRTWQPRQISLVASEIQAEAMRLQAAGLLPVFNVVDDDFGPLSRVEELAGELERRALRVAFSLEMRASSLLTELERTSAPALTARLARLHEAGLTRVFVGVESLNGETLRRWKKRYNLAGLPDLARVIRDAGIDLCAGYILWHSGSTLDSVREEALRLHELGLFSHKAALSRMLVLPGSALAADRGNATCTADPASAENAPTEDGFEALPADVHAAYQAFCAETATVTNEWLAAAIRQPYVAACAFLADDAAESTRIQTILDTASEASFRTLIRILGNA